jgi:phage gp36-like protein
MPYATAEQLKVRYPVLISRVKNLTEVGSEMIYFAAVDLDSRLGAKFTVPFTGPPPVITDLTLDLVACRIYTTADPEKAESICKSVQDRIDDILDGKTKIVTASGTTLEFTGAGQSVWSNMEDYAPVFSMLDPESEYSYVDSSRLDYEENLRS